MKRTGTAGLAPLGLAGVVLVLAAVHVRVDREPVAVEALEASILVALATALVAVSVRVVREEFSVARTMRLVTTSLVAGVALGGLSALYLVGRVASGEPVTEAWFVVSIGWSIGASAGAAVGYYVERVRREREEQAVLTGRLTVLQRVLRHNIRNEVTVIRGLTEEAARSTDDPELDGCLRTVTDHADRVYRLAEKAQRLTDLWNREGTVDVDLARVARAEVERFREAHPEVDVCADLPERAPAAAHRSVEFAVREALDNVAAHNGSDVSVDVAVVADGPWTSVEVVDDGSRVAEEELAALEASRELPLRHVTGLGLWVIYWVVELSGGRLDVENRDPAGVSVRMAFRTTGAGGSADPADASGTTGATGSRGVRNPADPTGPARSPE